MQHRRIALVGLGCIGAPSALHFLRACIGELRVLDHDFVSAGGSVRWPLGLAVVGMRKVDALREFAARNYPRTTISPHYNRIGDPDVDNITLLEALIESVDLLYDASAEYGVSHVLSDLAREKGIPYVCISTTPGGWGGRLVRVRPGITDGCWMCALHHLNDGTIATPPAIADDTIIQPQGCADPTFTAASFDVEEIALMGVRTAVSTLSGSVYPQTPWDLAILSLRNETGALITPQWRTFSLDRNPQCTNHEL